MPGHIIPIVLTVSQEAEDSGEQEPNYDIHIAKSLFYDAHVSSCIFLRKVLHLFVLPRMIGHTRHYPQAMLLCGEVIKL